MDVIIHDELEAGEIPAKDNRWDWWAVAVAIQTMRSWP